MYLCIHLCVYKSKLRQSLILIVRDYYVYYSFCLKKCNCVATVFCGCLFLLPNFTSKSSAISHPSDMNALNSHIFLVEKEVPD